MRGRRQDHPRCGDVGPCVAGGEHGKEDRLGAAGGDHAGESVWGVDESARDADEVVLHGQERGERRRVEAVGRRERGKHLAADRIGSEAGVVDVGERASAVGGQVTRTEHFELGLDLVERQARAALVGLGMALWLIIVLSSGWGCGGSR